MGSGYTLLLCLSKISITWFVVLLSFFFTRSLSSSSAIFDPTQDHPSFEIKSNQTSRSCSYTVIIKTSCSSVSYTTDQISLAFGDNYGNEVYAPRIDDPDTRTFERCSKYTFVFRGPCMDLICFMDVMRNGSDGWKPKSMKIYSTILWPITFYLDIFLLDGKWFTMNHCVGVSNSAFFNFAFL